jgi:hypothetical protein
MKAARHTINSTNPLTTKRGRNNGAHPLPHTMKND